MKKASNIRKLTRQGKRSFSLTLPIEMLKSFGWREKQRLRIKKVKGGLQIKDARTKKRKKR